MTSALIQPVFVTLYQVFVFVKMILIVPLAKFVILPLKNVNSTALFAKLGKHVLKELAQNVSK